MSEKKLVRKHLEVGSVIRTGLNDFWEVTCLLESKFQCKKVDFLGTEHEFTKEFNYNIGMVVLNEVYRNVY